MRKTTLALNLIVVAFFICFLAYTFVARQHLDSLARDFVTEKTLDYSKPVVDVADEALDSPLVKKLLSDDHETAIRREIADYQNDPSAYIADLTRQQLRDAPVANANPLIEKVAAIKNEIRTFYDDTLNALIADLHIFSVSNLIAGLIAFGLSYRSSSDIRKPIVWFSFLMFVAVLYCSYLYVDDLTFFRILFRTHMGWWYAALLCVMIVALYLDYSRHDKGTEPNVERERAITPVLKS
ncbi:hypothetical protein [Allorhodopirellula heiligendammensis]|uniref:Uncharacterized protein n=1 Tax=Allorhodopirellula heiligendammensis TaxID=2714739 RepID=A0A5C6C5G2_9BACT|nr:hypothetical protein [Allorhodopirellula heiligendammensis]TWU19237.1 hypothetical protein Poly21_14090 [Allorhodopirellula heiligendammensis]